MKTGITPCFLISLLSLCCIAPLFWYDFVWKGRQFSLFINHYVEWL